MHRVPKPSDLPRRYHRPERRLCPECSSILKRHHILWRKSLVLLSGQVYVTSWSYCCPNPGCSAAEMMHRSIEAEQLHLGRGQFGRDVVVQVGYWRFWQHLTVTEIHERLGTLLGLPISERQVLNMVGDFLALLRAAQPAKIEALRPQLAARGGLMIAIDGMQPETGNLCLYILRDPQLELTLLAESLEESSAVTLQKELLEPLKALAQKLGLPILGIVSDAQESIRQAVEIALLGVPHQCCHFHCLRDAGNPTFEADRSLKTALKKAIRAPLGHLEARISKLSADDPFHPILADYADAIRSTLLEGGVAPFELGGIRVFDALADLAASLGRCREKGGILSWIAYSELPTNAFPSPNAEINSLVSGSGSSTWSIYSILPRPHPALPKWPAKWTGTCLLSWPRSGRLAMSSTNKWQTTLTRPFVIAGGVSSPVTKSKVCHAPTTNWKHSSDVSKPVNAESQDARKSTTSLSVTVSLLLSSTTLKAKKFSWPDYVRSLMMTSSVSENAWSLSKNELPSDIASVTAAVSSYNG